MEEDRSIAIEAAIVRIMKMRKTSGNPEEMELKNLPIRFARFEYYKKTYDIYIYKIHFSGEHQDV